MITINVTYYNDITFLISWHKFMKRNNDEGLDIHYTFCDDGSQNVPAVDFFEKIQAPKNCSLYVVKKDIGFNSHGCRNLLMQQTKTRWNLLSDIDRLYRLDTIKSMCNTSLLNESEYYIPCFDKSQKPSVNDFFVTKDMYWKAGGYDEEYTNIHWGDRLFFDVLDTEATRVERKDWWVKATRGARNVTYEDIPHTLYPDDNTLIHPKGWWSSKQVREKMEAYIRKRNADPVTRKQKKIINFEWEQVF